MLRVKVGLTVNYHIISGKEIRRAWSPGFDKFPRALDVNSKAANQLFLSAAAAMLQTTAAQSNSIMDNLIW